MSNINPLLIKVKMPGRVFALPSMGVFYAPGVLAEDVKNGEIQVHPMSALAEMKMRTADLLFSGKVIKELCMECAPEILKPDALVSQDVDALFTFLRIVTYGDAFTVTSIHSCDDAHQYEYNISLNPVVSDPRNKSLTHKDELYRIELSNGQTAHTKPATYREAMESMHMRGEIRRVELAGEKVDEEKLTDITVFEVLSVIASVEVTIEDKTINVTDRRMITEWIRALPSTQLNELFKSIKQANDWGFDFNAKLKCKDCGEIYEHPLDLDPISFFYG